MDLISSGIAQDVSIRAGKRERVIVDEEMAFTASAQAPLVMMSKLLTSTPHYLPNPPPSVGPLGCLMTPGDDILLSSPSRRMPPTPPP